MFSSDRHTLVAFLAFFLALAVNAAAEPFQLCASARDASNPFTTGQRVFLNDTQLLIGGVDQFSTNGNKSSLVFTLSVNQKATSRNTVTLTQEDPVGVPESPINIFIKPQSVGYAGITSKATPLPDGATDYGFAVSSGRLGFHSNERQPVDWWGWAAWPVTDQPGFYTLGWDFSQTSSDVSATASTSVGNQPIPILLEIGTC